MIFLRFQELRSARIEIGRLTDDIQKQQTYYGAEVQPGVLICFFMDLWPTSSLWLIFIISGLFFVFIFTD